MALPPNDLDRLDLRVLQAADGGGVIPLRNLQRVAAAAARQLGTRAQHPRADARTVQDLHHLLGVRDGACDQ